MRTYEIACPKCGAPGVLRVDDIYIDNERVGEYQEYWCTCCGFKDAGYKLSRKKEQS